MKLAFVLLFFVAKKVSCWNAEVHKVIASIAVSKMKPQTVEIINAELAKWEDQFPGQSNIVDAAPWADELKCTRHSASCPYAPFDNISFLSSFHYINIPGNELGSHEYLPAPNTGSVFLLDNILDSLMGVSQPHFSQRSHESPVSNQKNFAHPTCAELNNVTYQKPPYSHFSSNFKLRLAIHVFADLHQPMHNFESFWPRFPEGDHGGEKIRILKAPHLNVHEVWDAAGFLKVKEPHLTASELLNELEEEVQENFMSGHFCGLEIGYIALESHRLAQQFAYIGLDPQSGMLDATTEYYNNVKKVCKKQIVAAGMRLALVLELMSHVLSGTDARQEEI